MAAPQWKTVCPLESLPPGSARVLKTDQEQVAIFRTDDDQLYAVDNRCPHEGYPLVQGDVQGCTLTCCWHNYKFDLRNGSCIKGEEAVRSYPVRRIGARIEVDLQPPDLGEAIDQLWTSMEEALLEERVSQASRDAVRLIQAGIDPRQIAAFAARHDAERALYGATHALPVATDVLRWFPRYPGARAVIPLAQALDLSARGSIRRPRHAAIPPEDPGVDPQAAGKLFRDRVEAEDLPGAEALLRGALRRGWGREVVEPWFFALCTDHFLSFGHRLIYQIKVFELLEAVDWLHAEPILVGHLRGILNGTREDVLPAWSSWRQRLARLDLDRLYAHAGQNPDWDGRVELLDHILDRQPQHAFDAMVTALRAGAPLERLVDTLSLAAAERLLRFDVQIDGDPGVQDGWLSVTHQQTFVHALRQAIRRFPQPAVLRLVFQAVRMINHHRVLDLPADQRQPLPEPTPLSLDALLLAIRAGRTTEALAGARSWLARPEAAEQLQHALMDLAISDLTPVPIVAAHLMKNTVAAHDERRSCGDPRPVLGLVRLMSSPIQQRWVSQRAHEAIAFVLHGKKPRLLAP